MANRFDFGQSSGGEPLPMVPIILTDRAGRSTRALSAIVDTGADGTIAPLNVLRAAGLRAGRQRRTLTAAQPDAVSEIVIGFLPNLNIGETKLSHIDVFGSRQISEVILGRNVLNQLVFTYDGPRRFIDLLLLSPL